MCQRHFVYFWCQVSMTTPWPSGHTLISYTDKNEENHSLGYDMIDSGRWNHFTQIWTCRRHFVYFWSQVSMTTPWPSGHTLISYTGKMTKIAFPAWYDWFRPLIPCFLNINVQKAFRLFSVPSLYDHAQTLWPHPKFLFNKTACFTVLVWIVAFVYQNLTLQTHLWLI